MRNFYHIFIGFTIMYWIGSFTGFCNYTLEGKVIGVPLISIVIGTVIGGFWEWCQSNINEKFFDWNDIFRTAIGTFVGGVFSLVYPSIMMLIYITCSVSVILIILEIFLLLKTYKHK